jgi:hypothetical protein
MCEFGDQLGVGRWRRKRKGEKVMRPQRKKKQEKHSLIVAICA